MLDTSRDTIKRKLQSRVKILSVSRNTSWKWFEKRKFRPYKLFINSTIGISQYEVYNTVRLPFINLMTCCLISYHHHHTFYYNMMWLLIFIHMKVCSYIISWPKIINCNNLGPYNSLSSRYGSNTNKFCNFKFPIFLWFFFIFNKLKLFTHNKSTWQHKGTTHLRFSCYYK